jgi:DNA-binding MarR family transcriptional regulator
MLMALGRRARDQLDARLRAHGLTYRHLSALGHLSGEPHVSYSELGRRAGVTAQSMQATIEMLQDHGAVEQVNNPGRGRRAHLQLTPQGLALLRVGRQAVQDAEAELLAQLPAADRETLRRLLFRLMTSTADAPPDNSTTPSGKHREQTARAPSR